MFVLRMTQNLARRYGARLVPPNPRVSPFCDWGCFPFQVSRRRFILVTNATTYLSFVISAPPAHLPSLVSSVHFGIEELLQARGEGVVYEKMVFRGVTKLETAASADRRLLGVMNDLSQSAKYHLEAGEILPTVSSRLNTTPLSPLTIDSSPERAWRRLIESSMSEPPPLQPEIVVQQQHQAFNRHDIEGLTAAYSADACQFAFPDRLLARGHADLRERWAQRFQDPKVRAWLRQRIVKGNFVTDFERITDSTGTKDLVAIYEVQEGKITRAWFI